MVGIKLHESASTKSHSVSMSSRFWKCAAIIQLLHVLELPSLQLIVIIIGFLVLMGNAFVIGPHAPNFPDSKYLLLSFHGFPAVYMWKWELNDWMLCVMLIFVCVIYHGNKT